MPNPRQKSRMRDYLVDRFRLTHVKAEPKTKEILRGLGEIDYILLGQEREGVVLMVNRHYPNKSLNRIYEVVNKHIPNSGLVFFKDGKTFFRSAAAGEDETGIKSKRPKLCENRSLKNYTLEDLRKMISFRPEETFARNLKSWVQYYQPESERLKEGIVSYKFSPVELDYSHIPSEERFGPLTKDSERLSIWGRKYEHNSRIYLDKGLIKDKN